MEMLAIPASKDHLYKRLDGVYAQHPISSRGSVNISHDCFFINSVFDSTVVYFKVLK